MTTYKFQLEDLLHTVLIVYKPAELGESPMHPRDFARHQTRHTCLARQEFAGRTQGLLRRMTCLPENRLMCGTISLNAEEFVQKRARGTGQYPLPLQVVEVFYMPATLNANKSFPRSHLPDNHVWIRASGDLVHRRMCPDQTLIFLWYSNARLLSIVYA